MKALFLLSFLLFLNGELLAQEYQSGPSRVSMVELYTSEGCSSCPPADRWLSRLQNDSGLWSTFVPMAFHVDYWDYIGWKDRFAKKEYSQRQRRYAREYQESTVYTPGVRRHGEEWRTWPITRSVSPSDETAGSLNLVVSTGGKFTATYSDLDDQVKSPVLNIAVLGMNLETSVKRGENRGKSLKHDFVVLGLSRYASADSGAWSGEILPPVNTAPKYAIAAWISDGQNVTPIQATGGFLAAESSSHF